MNIGKDVIDQIVSLLKREIAFAAYALPNLDDIEFIIDDNVSPVISSRKFIISTWAGEKFEISDRLNITEARISPIQQISKSQFNRTSSSWEKYESAINKITELLHTTEGKVVFSRLKVIDDSRINFNLIAESAVEMFTVHKGTFRAIYFTPSTGAWCICSPELLLEVDKGSGNFNTVALAGTRSGVTNDGWDDKNKREHNLVVRYISDTLSSLAISPEILSSETMNAGKIQHILTRIHGNISTPDGKIEINDIIDALHPTPAISGYPVKWAKGVITQLETHDRECYGGYIAIDTDERYLAHVNLRCFAFEPGHCCFWGGGGIMKDSSAISEWNESDMKMESTMAFINKRLSK